MPSESDDSGSGIPPGTPARGAAKRPDKRGQWTLKGDAFDIEFKTLVRKAAERQGMALNEWIATTLREHAVRVIKGDGAESTAGKSGPPATAQDDLLRMVVERLDALEKRTGSPGRSLWQRLMEAVRS